MRAGVAAALVDGSGNAMECGLSGGEQLRMTAPRTMQAEHTTSHIWRPLHRMPPTLNGRAPAACDMAWMPRAASGFNDFERNEG